jgi:hypothetical protein
VERICGAGLYCDWPAVRYTETRTILHKIADDCARMPPLELRRMLYCIDRWPHLIPINVKDHAGTQLRVYCYQY